MIVRLEHVAIWVRDIDGGEAGQVLPPIAPDARFGITWSFYLGEFLGVLFIFLGFLVSIEVFSDIRLPFTRIVLARRDREPRAEARAADGS